jgi:serine/threonine protein kinase
MAPEQFVAKKGTISNPFKCESFSLGVILFHLVFKEYPFSPNSYEDKNSQDPLFVQNFMNSSKNKLKVRISNELLDLLQRSLNFDPSTRCSV